MPTTASASTAPTSGVAVPASIPHAGEADATAGLQAFLTGLADGTAVLFDPDAVYRIDGTVTLDHRTLALNCRGCQFVAGPEANQTGQALRNLAVWRIDGGAVSFWRPVVRGRNQGGGTGDRAYDASREAQHAFDVHGCDRFLLEGADIGYVFGDCVYLGPGSGSGPAAWSANAQILGGELHHTGRQGIALTAARHVLIDGVSLHDMRRSTFDLEPTTAAPGWGVDDVTIQNCRTGTGRLLWIADQGGGWSVRDVKVLNNTMVAPTGSPVITMVGPAPGPNPGDIRGPVTIDGNTFVVSGNVGFNFENIGDVTFTNNHATFAAGASATAVTLKGATTATIRGNDFGDVGTAVHADPTAHWTS